MKQLPAKTEKVNGLDPEDYTKGLICIADHPVRLVLELLPLKYGRGPAPAGQRKAA